MYSIKHLFHIHASKEKVFEAISTIHGLSNWWTTKTSGSDAVGGVLTFHFGEMEGPQMKVIELKPNEKVSWECVKSPFNWDGNIFTFSLDENDGKTRVRFLENALSDEGDGNPYEAAGKAQDGGFSEQHFDNVEAGKAKGLQDANLACALQDHGVHVE